MFLPFYSVQFNYLKTVCQSIEYLTGPWVNTSPVYDKVSGLMESNIW